MKMNMTRAGWLLAFAILWFVAPATHGHITINVVDVLIVVPPQHPVRAAVTRAISGGVGWIGPGAPRLYGRLEASGSMGQAAAGQAMVPFTELTGGWSGGFGVPYP